MNKSRVSGLAAVAILLAVSMTVLLASCPLPFEFSPRGTVSGTGGSDDPANPSVTAMPKVRVVSKITGQPLAIIDTDALVLLETETRDAVIYYRSFDLIGGALPPVVPSPQPGQTPGTLKYDPADPPEVEGHLSSFGFSAVAIGPNMYPSVEVVGAIEVVYAMAATPTFSPLPTGPAPLPPYYDTADWPVSVTIASTDPDATIYYEQVTGAGPAPDPVPGVSPEYLGPITLTGTPAETSIAAIAVVDQKEASFVAHANYLLEDHTPPAPPTLIAASNGNEIDSSQSAILEYRTLFADNVLFTATSGGGGGGGWEYRYNRGSGWSAWFATAPTGVAISSGVGVGAYGHLEVECRESDGAGNWSAPAYRIVTVDRTLPFIGVTINSSGFPSYDHETRLTFLSRRGGVRLDFHLVITDTIVTIFDVVDQVNCPIGLWSGSASWTVGGALFGVNVGLVYYEADPYGNISPLNSFSN